MSPLGLKAIVGSLIHTWQRRICYIFPGVTPVDVLAGSLVAEPLSFMYLQAGIGGA